MNFPEWLPVFGDKNYRGKCPKEDIEQISFFNKLRKDYPDSLGVIALHPRNEGLKEKGQFSMVQKHRAEGMTKGASDIVIPGCPSFVCELKRQDHTLSVWQEGQMEYLKAANDAGSFVCVALGAKSAFEALNIWVDRYR